MRRPAVIIAISLLSIACAAPAGPGWTFPPDSSAAARPEASTLEVAAASPSPSVNPSAAAVQPGADAGVEVAAAVAPSSASVTIADFAFGPSTVTIAAGGQVTWTNRDSERHSVRVGDIESSRLESSASYARTFDSAGRFAYVCGLHPSMTGTILVVQAGADVPVAPGSAEAAPGTATSTAEPTADASAEPTATADPTHPDDSDDDDHSGHDGGGDDDADHSGHGDGGDGDDDDDHSGPGGGGSGPG